MYSLFIDKPTEFACDISVKNASLKNSIARMIVVSEGVSLLFEGKIKDGKCLIPISRLKGFLDENATGEMKLEVIVEDTYFTPWQDKFLAESNTSVKVKIQEQRKPSKPLVKITSIKEQKKLSSIASDLVFICERVGITKTNVGKRKKDFAQVIKEYFKANPEGLKHRKQFISETVNALK